MSASFTGQLPRNEHQVSNIWQSVKKTTVSCVNDELFIAMTECKSNDITAQFVRDEKAAPDPALLLATDQQQQTNSMMIWSDFAHAQMSFVLRQLIQLLTWEILMSHC